jgi:hypothetical protein
MTAGMTGQAVDGDADRPPERRLPGRRHHWPLAVRPLGRTAPLEPGDQEHDRRDDEEDGNHGAKVGPILSQGKVHTNSYVGREAGNRGDRVPWWYERHLSRLPGHHARAPASALGAVPDVQHFTPVAHRAIVIFRRICQGALDAFRAHPGAEGVLRPAGPLHWRLNFPISLVCVLTQSRAVVR